MSNHGKAHYTKPWKSYADQVRTLVSRGLVVTDPKAAGEILSHIKYYRFSGYCLAFESERHKFLPGTTFKEIVKTYEFDRRLRRYLVEAIEWIEIDVRTAVAHEFGRLHGSFAHTDGQLFRDRYRHADWLQRIRAQTENSQETFAIHHRDTYAEFPDLPIWAAVEIMSLGSLSHLFSNMRNADRTPIANRYHIQAWLMASWLHHLTYVRNLCAHYSRFWDRKMAIAPKLAPNKSWDSVFAPQKLYPTLLVVATMLQPIHSFASEIAEWKHAVERHIFDHLRLQPLARTRMGFPDGWHEQENWKSLDQEETEECPKRNPPNA